MTQHHESISFERQRESIDASVGAGISSQLRKFYGAIQNEEIPDRILTLLEQLDQAEKNAVAKTAAEERAS